MLYYSYGRLTATRLLTRLGNKCWTCEAHPLGTRNVAEWFQVSQLRPISRVPLTNIETHNSSK